MPRTFFNSFLLAVLLAASAMAYGQGGKVTTISQDGWSHNSVNTVIFRKNALFTHNQVQYAAFYDSEQYVVLAKRQSHSSNWIIQRSNFKGDANDAHKSISIIVDGSGFIHIAWSQHDNELNYAQSTYPGSLQLGKRIGMLGDRERKVSYPEFYRLSTGDLIFLYRDGGSGNGNLVINRFEIKNRTWSRVQENLLDGEGKRNAYWQASLDPQDGIHLSWVWREHPDVASNHDLCYAMSPDGGKSWKKSSGSNYQLPINITNAEYAVRIPQNSGLINQTAMVAHSSDRVFIAGYWRDKDSKVTQYHIVDHTAGSWRVRSLKFRNSDFLLGGTGTKQIPISRPQIISWQNHRRYKLGLIFRDFDRGNKPSIALNEDSRKNNWKIFDLHQIDLGDWEPNFDTELWNKKHILSLFLQKVNQVDGEGWSAQLPTLIQVLDWTPKSN